MHGRRGTLSVPDSTPVAGSNVTPPHVAGGARVNVDEIVAGGVPRTSFASTLTEKACPTGKMSSSELATGGVPATVVVVEEGVVVAAAGLDVGDTVGAVVAAAEGGGQSVPA